MPSLNIRQRAGIAATACWALGWSIYWAKPVARCVALTNPWDCDPYADKPFATLASDLGFSHWGVWGQAGLGVVILPVVIWVAVWAGLRVYRWVLAGRRPAT